MKFLSPEWIGQYEPMAKSIFAPGKTPTACEGTFLEVYHHVKAADNDTVWILYEFEDGLLVEQSHGTGRAPRGADFLIEIDFDLPKKLVKREVKLDEVMDSGLVNAQMNFIKFMPVELAMIEMQVLKLAATVKLPVSRHCTVGAIRCFNAYRRRSLKKRGVALK